MIQNDPTDHALAAIASILDQSSDKHDGKAESTSTQQNAIAAPVIESEPLAPPVDIDHYSKFGPGPLDAIRFRWAARRGEDGRYFVDETIGPLSRPLVLGPMPQDEVVNFIDAREAAARRRFDALKNQMTFHQRIASDDTETRGES